MIKAFLLSLIFSLSILTIQCQNENKVWLLSQNLKLDFTNQIPVLSQENNNFVGDNESCVVISSSDNGDLLFYSEGRRVWNKDHNLMAGSITDRKNFFSTYQGVLAVKSSTKNNLYYLYSLESVPTLDQFTKGRLYISEIDMEKNGGLGEVVSTKLIGDNFTEQMVAKSHPCEGVWLILHERENNTYVAIHIIENQVIKIVKTNIGIVQDSFPDYRKFVGSLILSKNNNLVNLNGGGNFEVCRFNEITGKISDLISLDNNINSRYISGIFAPNDSFFYLIQGDLSSSWVEQLDFSEYEFDKIKSSKVKLPSIPNQIIVPVSKFALGNDNKIYYTSPVNYYNLGVINYPNTKGLGCDFNPLQISTSNTQVLANKALPTALVFSTPSLKDFLPKDTSFCKVPTLTISHNVNHFDSLRWSNGQIGNTIVVNGAGQYSLTLFKNGCEYRDTIVVSELPLRTLDLGPNISICRAERHNVTIPTITGDQVMWSDGNMQANRIFTAPGTYIISITTTDGCVITDSITISRSFSKIPKTTTIDLCEGEIYDYRGQIYQAGETIIDSLEAAAGCDTLWTIALNDIAAPTILRDTTTCDNAPIILNNKTYQIGDTIKLLKNSPTGCDTLVQVLYKRYESSVEGVSLSDTLVCKDGTTKATIVASSFSNLLWSNGDQSLNTELGAGTHFLQATDDRGCVRIIPFEIKSFPSIQYEIQATDPSCGQNNGSIVIINNAPDINFTTSINGSITQSVENLPSGKYNITLTYENRCETLDSIILNNISDLDVTLPSEISGTIDQIISIAYQSSGGSIDTITFSPTANIEWIADSIAVAIMGDRVYSITFIDEYGCTVTKTLTIYADLPTSTLVLPNIISSQSTNTENTLFYLKTQGITYDMSIYDRWGNLIHHAQKITSGDLSQAWQPNITKVGQGVYVYLIAIYTDNGIVYKYGTVTVI